MTKDELATEAARKTGIEKVEAIKILETMMDAIRVNMSKNKNIYLRGFGSFLVKKRAKKTARNISKNTAVIIPEHYVPVFKPAKEFVAKVKGK